MEERTNEETLSLSLHGYVLSLLFFSLTPAFPFRIESLDLHEAWESIEREERKKCPVTRIKGRIGTMAWPVLVWDVVGSSGMPVSCVPRTPFERRRFRNVRGERSHGSPRKGKRRERMRHLPHSRKHRCMKAGRQSLPGPRHDEDRSGPNHPLSSLTPTATLLLSSLPSSSSVGGFSTSTVCPVCPCCCCCKGTCD